MLSTVQGDETLLPSEEAVRQAVADAKGRVDATVDNVLVNFNVLSDDTILVRRVRRVPSGVAPEDVLANTTLDSGLKGVLQTFEDHKRRRSELHAAAEAAGISRADAAELVNDTEDDDDGRVSETQLEKFERSKRQSVHFLEQMRHLTETLDIFEFPPFERLRSVFSPKSTDKLKVIVFHVRCGDPFFIVCSDLSKEYYRKGVAWIMGRKIWACQPMSGVTPMIQADRIALMYSASPSPIQFRDAYITSGGKLLSEVIHLSSQSKLLKTVFSTFLGPRIRVHEVSGYFDSHDHSETLDVPQLVQSWIAMTPAERAAIVGDKETARVGKKAKVLQEKYDELLEHDHGEEPLDPDDMEAKEGDDDEEGGPPSDEGSSGSDEEEEDSDEEEEDEEDSFIVSDSCCSSEESLEEEEDESATSDGDD